MTQTYRGSCLCGTVKFEIEGFDGFVSYCHCKMCRKFHGAAFSTMASVPKEQFSWTAGEASLKRYTGSNDTIRTFCENCGSSLSYWNPRAAQDVIEIAIGALDDDSPVRPNAHIFVDFSANWVNWGEKLPRYREGRTSELIED